MSNSPRAGWPVAHVERLEVVPVGLDLGPFGDLEAEADEHVLEPLPRLGDEVGVAALRLAGELGEVEPLATRPERRARRCRARRGGSRAPRDRGHRLVDGLAGGLLLVDDASAAELGLELGEGALLAGQPRLSRAVTSSSVAADSISASAASRAAVMSESTWMAFQGCTVGPVWWVDVIAGGASPVHPGHENRCNCGFTAQTLSARSPAGATGQAGTVRACGSTEIGEIDGWRCWLCDEPVDPDMSVNNPRGPSIDSRTTERQAKAKGTGKGKGKGTRSGAADPPRVQHRQGCRRSGDPVARRPVRRRRRGDHRLGGPLVTQGRAGSGRPMPRPGRRRAAAAWIVDRISRLEPGLERHREHRSRRRPVPPGPEGLIRRPEETGRRSSMRPSARH